MPFTISAGDSMSDETPKQAAHRLAAKALPAGFLSEALHVYTDENGAPLYWKLRAKHPDGRKWIRPMHFNGRGYHFGEPKFNSGKPLYALHRIVANPEAPVWIVEGEQKADALNRLGLVATTSGGAASAGAADWGPLQERPAVIWPDHDEAGRRYGATVAATLTRMGCTVTLIDTEELGLPESGDAIDWLRTHPHATAANIEALSSCAAQSLRDANVVTTSPVHDEDANVDQLLCTRAADLAPQSIQWLWPHRIALGKVTLLIGDPGLGKSLLTVGLAAHVTNGRPWPVDSAPCEKGDVIFLSAEDDAADTIRPRLDAAGADVRRVYIVHGVREVDRSTGKPIRRMVSLKRDLETVEHWLVNLPECRLLVIDPVSAYLDGTDSHKNAEVRGVLAPLAELAKRRRIAVVCVTHLNKGGGTNAMYRAMGSVAFVAAARCAYLVTADEENASRRLVLPVKNNLAADSTGVAFTIIAQPVPECGEIPAVAWDSEVVTITADVALSRVTAPEERGATNDAMDFLRELLADGPLASRQVRSDAEGAGHSWATIRVAQKRLGIKAHKLGMRGGWMWALPSKTIVGSEDTSCTRTSTFDDGPAPSVNAEPDYEEF